MKFRHVRRWMLLSAVSLAGTAMTGCSSGSGGGPSEDLSESEYVTETETVLESVEESAGAWHDTDATEQQIREAETETETEAQTQMPDSMAASVYSDTLPEETAGQLDTVLKAISRRVKSIREDSTETEETASGQATTEGSSSAEEDPDDIIEDSAQEPNNNDADSVDLETLVRHLYPGYDFLISHPVAMPEKSLTLLRSRLASIIEDYDGTWSVFVRDLSSEESLSIHDQAMPSASTMKLFVMGAVYEAFSEGTLTRTDETVNLIKNMISYSSNEDTNRLLYLLGNEDYRRGIEVVNHYISANGYSEYTHLYNPFQDDSLILEPDHTNQTSARDCALLLEMVYRRVFGSWSVCNEIEDMMLAQSTRYKIPSGVDGDARVGNKTGETDTVENDTAIVYTPQGDYILCIFSTGWDSKNAAQSHFTQLSAEVYHYFTSEDYVSQYVQLPVIPGWNEDQSL